MTEEEINKVIARILLSTKRKKRQYSIFEIASDIDSLRKSKGNINEVSKLIGISAEMLNQFLSVFKLPPPIIDLVNKRKIDRVSMVHYLSKFNEDDALKLANLLASNKLSSLDLRALIPFRKQYAYEPIFELVNKMHSSKNIKVYVIKFCKQETNKSIDELESYFSNQVGKDNLIKIESKNNFIEIKLSKNGEKILRQKAKNNKKTFQELITIIIH